MAPPTCRGAIAEQEFAGTVPGSRAFGPRRAAPSACNGMTLWEERHPGAERERSERTGQGRDPGHFNACSSMRMRATVRRCAWVPCLRPTARCAVGLHGMTLRKERHPGAERERSERAGPGRDPGHFNACASMRMRATVRRCAWVPCHRPTARCAVGLHGMTLWEGEPLSPTSSRRCERPDRALAGTGRDPCTSPLALGCACARRSGAVPGSRAFGPRRAAP